MKVHFLNTRRVSEDGFSVIRCMKGQTYDLADTAAIRAIKDGDAVAVDAKTPQQQFRELLDELRQARIVRKERAFNTAKEDIYA